MATLTAGQRLRQEHNREWQENFANWKSRVIDVGQFSTLSGENLEVGDTLPDDSTYEIVSSRLDTADGKQVAVVTAMGPEDTVAGQSPWSELRETRQNQDTRAVKRFQVTLTGTKGSALPRRGQAYSAITGTSATLKGAGIEIEPRAAAVGEVQELTRTRSRVTVTFEAYWPVQGTLPNKTEYYCVRRTCTQDTPYWTGVEEYYVAEDGDADKIASLIRGRRQVGPSAYFAPTCHKAESEFSYFGDNGSRVVAMFKTQLLSDRRQPGRATVSIEAQANARKVLVDLDGKRLAGGYYDVTSPTYGHGLNSIRLKKGDPVVYEGRALIRLKTAYEKGGMSAQDIADIMLLQGKVNDKALPNFGNFEKGTLQLLASPHTKQWDESGLWYVDYVFAVSPIYPLPWNDYVERALYANAVVNAPVMELTGSGVRWTAVTSQIRQKEVDMDQVFVRRRTSGTSTWTLEDMSETIADDFSKTRLYEEANFDALNAMVVWEDA